MITREMRQEQIDQIMDNFLFEHVHNVMQHLNWCWHPNERPPTLDEIRLHARDLLNKLPLSDSYQFIAWGGFRAEILSHDVIRLSFEVDEWTTYKY